MPRIVIVGKVAIRHLSLIIVGQLYRFFKQSLRLKLVSRRKSRVALKFPRAGRVIVRLPIAIRNPVVGEFRLETIRLLVLSSAIGVRRWRHRLRRQLKTKHNNFFRISSGAINGPSKGATTTSSSHLKAIAPN
jgi:hypothetical protein